MMIKPGTLCYLNANCACRDLVGRVVTVTGEICPDGCLAVEPMLLSHGCFRVKGYYETSLTPISDPDFHEETDKRERLTA